MCPLTKEPCSSHCQWFTQLFAAKDGKEYFGCILKKIEIHLNSIADITTEISINTSTPLD
jgi:hypothetical protein